MSESLCRSPRSGACVPGWTGAATGIGHGPDRDAASQRVPRRASSDVSAGLQRAAADLQMPFGSLRGQQRLRRRDPRRAQRRLGPDGWRHAGHRECLVRDAAHAHRIFPRLQRRQGGSAAAGGGTDHPGLCGPAWNAIARSSRKCSTASPWISAAPRNTACPPRSFWPISGRGRTTRPRCWRRYSKWGAIGSSSPAASIRASRRADFTINLQTPVGAGRPPPWRRNATAAGLLQTAGACRATSRRHGSLLQLDREPGPGLPGQRQEHLRIPRHVVSPLAATREWASSIYYTDNSAIGASGPTGFPPAAWPIARSGTTIWSPATWTSSASASCRPIKSWRCSTRIS